MNSKHFSYVMTGVVVLLMAGIIGAAYAASSLLAKQAATLNDLKVKQLALEAEQRSLIKAKKDIEKYKQLNVIAQTIVPKDKDQAEAVREIVKIARESGLNPSSITFPSSTLGAPTAASGPGLTQLTPVKGNAGLYLLPITITQETSRPVEYTQFVNFLSRLEQNRRTSQVANIVLNPNSQNRNLLSFTLTVNMYIKP